MELFDYLNERDKKGLKIAIGQWLGYKFSNIVKENGLEINFINNIDRMKLAERI